MNIGEGNLLDKRITSSWLIVNHKYHFVKEVTCMGIALDIIQIIVNLVLIVLLVSNMRKKDEG